MSALDRHLNWDDVRVFVAVARCGALGAAARDLRLNATTVSRRLGRLERTVGAALFDRAAGGFSLTAEGGELFRSAQAIEADLAPMAGDIAGAGESGPDVVKLATPVGLGSLLIAGSLGDFIAQHPGIVIELIPEPRTISLARHEADIAIASDRPPSGRHFSKKLSSYRLGLYASEAYVAANGAPATIAEVGRHQMVWFIDDLILTPEFRGLDSTIAGASVAFRSPSTIAQQNAVGADLGIGLLPHYMARNDPRLVRLLPGFNVERRYWVLLHATHRLTPPVRAVLGFLEDLVRRNRDVLMAE